MSLSFAGMGLSMLAMAAGLALPFLSGALPRLCHEAPGLPCLVCWAAAAAYGPFNLGVSPRGECCQWI